MWYTELIGVIHGSSGMASEPSDRTFLAAARAASEARSFNQNLQCHCRNFAGNPSHPTRILYPSHIFPLHPPFATPAVSHFVCRRRTISGQIWPLVWARAGRLWSRARAVGAAEELHPCSRHPAQVRGACGIITKYGSCFTHYAWWLFVLQSLSYAIHQSCMHVSCQTMSHPMSLMNVV